MSDDGGLQGGEVPIPQPDESNPATFPADTSESTASHHDAGPASAIWQLISRHPYRALWNRWSDISPLRGWARACFVMEFIVTTIGVAIILGAGFFIAWKAIVPIPHW